MNIGDLNKRITLQYPSRVSDSMGGFTVTWVDATTAWAAIWPVSATEQIQAAQQVITITHKIRIRYRSGIESSWRVKFGDRYFSIVSIINPNERNRMLDILCKEAA